MNETGSNKESVDNYITSLGLHPMEQYLAVLRYIFNENGHPTADEIYDALRITFTELSLTRVYTILNVLCGLGILEMVQGGKEMVFYDATKEAHAHLICNKCGSIKDIPLPKECAQYKFDDFKVEKVRMQVLGYCPDCAPENKE